MYIKQVKLKNFKLFSHGKIDFKKGLTIIIGGHSTGKSTIIDAIRFVIDPFFETSSENLNLLSFNYKPNNSNCSKIGYVELSFFCRDTDINIFTVRRCFSELKVVKINQRQEMNMGDFYRVLRSHNYLTNSFMSSFIGLEVLYKIDNNNGLFKNLFFYISEHLRFFTLVRNLVTSTLNIIKSKLEKLTDYTKYHFSTLSDQEANIISSLQSAYIFDEYIYKMRKQRNIHQLLQHELDNLNYLEEFQCELHATNINNIVSLSNDIYLKTQSSTFVSINALLQEILTLVGQLHNKVNEVYDADITSFASYPKQLDAHQHINRYVMNLRRTLKASNKIAEIIESDIKLLNTIIDNKRSKQAKLIQSIQSNLVEFLNTKRSLEDISLTMTEIEDDNTFQPFKHCIEFFLNERLFYFKMKLIICFDYHSSILKGLQYAIKICGDRRIIPVFNCIRFKNDFIIKDNFYEFLKPIIDWIIIIESVDAPFVVPQPSKMYHGTWVPTQHLYHSTKIILEAETQNIWDGLDMAALHETKVLMKCEKPFLKFIFYQRQLARVYETSMLSGGGNQSRPNDIIELCHNLQSFYRISNFQDELKLHTNIFTNQTDIPRQLCSFKDHLDSIIVITKTLKNGFERLLAITEELHYNEEDLKLKIRCLKEINMGSELDLVIEDFDPPRYKNSMDNIDRLKIKIENLERKSSWLIYTFNKLDVYLPLDEFVVIVPDTDLRKTQMKEWDLFVKNLQSEFLECEQMSQDNLLVIAEIGATVHNMRKIFLTEDEEIKNLMNKNQFRASELTKWSYYDTLQQTINFVYFHEKVLAEIYQALKTIQKVKHLKLTSDVYPYVMIQVFDQVNKSIDIANQLLENFNHTMKIGFNDWINNLDQSSNEDNPMNVLKSFQFIIQKKINHYQEQSMMFSLIDEMPTQGDLYLAKLMFILGVSLHNKHKLLTLDDISVMLNKNKNLLINIARLEEIYQEQQVILTCTPSEIVLKDMKEVNEYFMRVAQFEGVTIIDIDDQRLKKE